MCRQGSQKKKLQKNEMVAREEMEEKTMKKSAKSCSITRIGYPLNSEVGYNMTSMFKTCLKLPVALNLSSALVIWKLVVLYPFFPPLYAWRHVPDECKDLIIGPRFCTRKQLRRCKRPERYYFKKQ